MRLLLIRHGQIPSNVLGILDTDRPGPSLTDLGRVQAGALADTLHGEPLEAAWASVLVRTEETIAPTVGRMGLTTSVLEGAREIRAGDLEGRSDRDSQVAYMRTVFAWATGDLTVRMPGGESGTEFFARYDAAIEEIIASGAKDAVLVSHGAAIRCWAALRVAGSTQSFYANNPLPNTGIVPVEGGPGAWRMREWRTSADGRPVVPVIPTDDPTGAPPVGIADLAAGER